MAEQFTEEEKKLLRPFVTNLDKDVFCLTNLPEVVKGALFSRYSRSEKSLRRMLLEEFILQPETGFKEIVGFQEGKGEEQTIAIKKAEEFYDRVLVGYGDDSVAELGGAHVACENMSNVASKLLEDARIGISPLEKSTRYVAFDKKENGAYKYLQESGVMHGKHADAYLQACDFLFDTYSKLFPKVLKWVGEKNPRQEGVSDRAYAASVKAKAFDLLRGLLPASALTNVGLHGNGRAFEYLLTKLYSSDLQEARSLAREMNFELGKVIPSFVKRADSERGRETQDYWRKTRRAVASLSELIPAEQSRKQVELVDFDKDAEEKIVAAVLYPSSNATLASLKKKASIMGREEKAKVIRAYVGDRLNRRHKPGRAFEHAFYTFDLLGNYGMFRDLHRHRVLTQERQLLGCMHGYDVPSELDEAGFGKDFREALENASSVWKAISKDSPLQAQYVVPLAFRIRWLFKLNAREMYHLIELRSSRQGHLDYRRMALDMLAEAAKVHPSIFEGMVFADKTDYGLERLEAEKKIDEKKEKIEKKYGKKS